MRDALVAFRPGGQGTPPPQQPDRRTNPGNLLGTFACYPELAHAYLTFNGHVLYQSSLPARAREILILRVAVLRRCAYEWAQHVVLGGSAGLTAEEIDWIVEGPERPEWDALDRSLLHAVDQLVTGAQIADGTWADLAQYLDERQRMDLVFTVGAYKTLAMALLSFGVDPDIEIIPNLPATTGAWSRHGDQPNEGTP
jgi:alkylhydroperoxidase family enzyme